MHTDERGGSHRTPKGSDLVMHYTFDKDESERVTDHSSYGHDAENTNAQWLADVQGRSGVMRFNGTDAKLTAQYPPRAMEGDATITIWIRRNAEEMHSRCSIFPTLMAHRVWTWVFPITSISSCMTTGLIRSAGTSECHSPWTMTFWRKSSFNLLEFEP